MVLADLERGLLFVEGSVPGPKSGIVTVTRGRKSALAGFDPPVLPSSGVAVEDLIEAADEVEDEAIEETVEAPADEAAVEAEATVEEARRGGRGR